MDNALDILKSIKEWIPNIIERLWYPHKPDITATLTFEQTDAIKFIIKNSGNSPAFGVYSFYLYDGEHETRIQHHGTLDVEHESTTNPLSGYIMDKYKRSELVVCWYDNNPMKIMNKHNCRSFLVMEHISS